MKYLTTLITTLLLILPLPVSAAYSGSATTYEQCENFSSGVYTGVTVTLSEQFDCRTDVACKINQAKGIPCQDVFQSNLLDPRTFSLLSWITLLVNLAIFGVLAYLIFLIIKGGLVIVGSMGVPDKIADGQRQISAALKALVAMFIFIAILLLAGSFFGFGAIWEWPRAFSQCSNHDNKFYFTVQLEQPGTPVVCN